MRFTLRFEIDIGLPRSPGTWPEGVFQTNIGSEFPAEIRDGSCVISYDADSDDEALDRGNVLSRAVRGGLGIHFGQPPQLANVTITDAATGRQVSTLPNRDWSMGWSDVIADELTTAASFLTTLDIRGPYARALDYYNQGRLHLEQGMPEAAVVFFYKVLEALAPLKDDREKTRRRWLTHGFSAEDMKKLDLLATYRNQWDAAHTDVGKGRVAMSQARQAEETALLVLIRCAPEHGVHPRPPRRQIHFVGTDRR
jgi:hypothetical protein